MSPKKKPSKSQGSLGLPKLICYTEINLPYVLCFRTYLKMFDANKIEKAFSPLAVKLQVPLVSNRTGRQ